jgi:hypothetical protein
MKNSHKHAIFKCQKPWMKGHENIVEIKYLTNTLTQWVKLH